MNRAEIAICEGKLTLACKIYRKSLCLEQFPFAVDVQNALICELEQPTLNPQAKKYFDYLIYLNTELDTTYSKSYGYYLLNGNQHKAEVAKWISNQPSKNKDAVSIDSLLNTLTRRDQEIRTYCWRTYSLPTYSSICLDTIQFVDSLNQIELENLFIGNYNIHLSALSWYAHNSISLLAQHSLNWEKFPLKQTLLNLIKEGKFDPRLYTSICDRVYQYEYYTQDTITGSVGTYGTHIGEKIGDYYFIFKEPNDNYKFIPSVINMNRKSLFLEDYVVYHKKLAYQLLYAELPFIFRGGSILNDKEIGEQIAEDIRKYDRPVIVYDQREKNNIHFSRKERRGN